MRANSLLDPAFPPVIYAFKATDEGRLACRLGDEKISTKRMVLIAMAYRKYLTIEDLTTQLHELEDASEEQTREDFDGYWMDSDQIVNDLRWLEARNFLVLARYRVFQDGRFKYAAERVVGLHFHGD